MESHYRWLRLDRADGLHGAGADGHLSARPAADPVHDGGIRDARSHGDHGARGGVFSGLWRQAVGRPSGCDAAQRYYNSSWETFLGNAGLVQCFANGDQSTLDYIARRLEQARSRRSSCARLSRASASANC